MSSPMDVYEKLGVFYLGREVDPQGKTTQTPLLYDSRDLVTHAVIVGMTGSGKTGLGISLLEEAAIDGIPSLIIDPKGDLANLLLTFPELRPSDFVPWVNPDDARRKGVSLDEFAEDQASAWRTGLAEWDQDGARIARLREAAEFRVYTPGSDAGTPISILSSFAAPPPEMRQEADLMRDRVATTVTSLLGLLGRDADPIQSREHILLTNIIDHAWRQGQDVGLSQLIRLVQTPPMQQIGVMDLEAFFPDKERFELAMLINNLLASPSFSAWLQGVPLDINQLLYTPQGKPRMAIISIAHLSEAERMFFVSLLLNQTLGWMRTRSGTSSLRALLYIDEIFGYMPPLGEPPSKKPLLTLLKQARAYGVGLVLATQNPVDLDYKGLSNAGTWFIGRLQTDQDKQRILKGLQGAAAESGGGIDPAELSDLLAGLGKRVFLMHNVHEPHPVLFQTRWALSYLSGPMTRQQIRTLQPRPAVPDVSPGAPATAPNGLSPTQDVPPHPSAAVAAAAPPVPEATAAPSQLVGRPVLPKAIAEYYLPCRGWGNVPSPVHYEPKLLAHARVHFVDTRKGLEADETLVWLVPITDRPVAVDFEQAEAIDIDPQQLDTQPTEPAEYAGLPSVASDPKNYKQWARDWADHLYRTRRYPLWHSPALGEFARPGESERDFRVRLLERSRETRDAAVAELRKSYESKLKRLQERRNQAERALLREEEQASQAKMSSIVSIGSTVISAIFGRKTLSSRTISNAGSAARNYGRVSAQDADVRAAQQKLEAADEDYLQLEQEMHDELARVEASLNPLKEPLAQIDLKPRKTDVDVRLMALVWRPNVSP